MCYLKLLLIAHRCQVQLISPRWSHIRTHNPIFFSFFFCSFSGCRNVAVLLVSILPWCCSNSLSNSYSLRPISPAVLKHYGLTSATAPVYLHVQCLFEIPALNTNRKEQFCVLIAAGTSPQSVRELSAVTQRHQDKTVCACGGA